MALAPLIALLVLVVGALLLAYSALRGIVRVARRATRPRAVRRTKVVRFDAPLPPPLTEAERRHEEAAEAIRQVREDLVHRQAAEAELQRIAAQPQAVAPAALAAETPRETGLRLAAESTARRKAAEAAIWAADAATRPLPANDQPAQSAPTKGSTAAEPFPKAVLELLPSGLWEGKLINAPIILLHYRDTKGDVSKRAFLPQRARGPGEQGGALSINAISGFCMMRKANRTFLVSGILSAADPTTGELVDLAEMVSTHMEQR